jgi:transcription elongation factor Elf1
MSDKKKKFEFSCCKCGNIPEILKIHTDNSKIELNCKICGKYEIFINEYFKELEKNNNFKKCSLCLNEKKIMNSFIA